MTVSDGVADCGGADLVQGGEVGRGGAAAGAVGEDLVCAVGEDSGQVALVDLDRDLPEGGADLVCGVDPEPTGDEGGAYDGPVGEVAGERA